MNYFLFRAVACVRDFDQPETHVFFEAPAGVRPGEELAKLLTISWNVPTRDVIVYNVWTEHELLEDMAFGDACTGDARLFETGFADCRVRYADPARTQFFCRPAMQQRLVLAQAAAQKLAAAQRASTAAQLQAA